MKAAFVYILFGIAATAGCHATRPAISPVETTIGDLQSLHSAVTVGSRDVLGAARLRDGDEVKTGAGGRARARLDDGTVLVVDQNADLTLRGGSITLAHGRLFVQAGSRVTVAVGDTITTIATAAAGFDADRGARGEPKVYCAHGDLVVTRGGSSWPTATGETATLTSTPSVAPETAFDDWTGGLAVPWSGEHPAVSAIAEAWGTTHDLEPTAPLVIRREKVNVMIDGEVASTRTRTTYFNGADHAIEPDVRLAIPRGAILSHVGRAEEGAKEESVARIAPGNRALVTEPGRLEWAGGGAVRGTLSAVPAGGTFDLLVDWVEWLPETNGRATYRFPMASEGPSPLVGNLDVRVESRAPAKWLSASAGAALIDGGLELRGADLRPTGDLVVELVPGAVERGGARAYVEDGPAGEDPFVLVRTEAPATDENGVSLALVIDTSSSAGPALLEMERAAALAVIEALGPHDSVVVIAADQDTAIVGPPKPSPVTPELRAVIRADLAQLRASGASNLGLGLERAADLLDSGDHAESGMVVYLGDGRPTVGEVTAESLRKRLARRSSGVPRLGALAVGQGADHWLLAGLAAGSGPVYDVLDRESAARASSLLVAAALTPTVRDVTADLGATIDRVYPREARAVNSNNTITFAGRLAGTLPRDIQLRYRKNGAIVSETRSLVRQPLADSADLERRWASERIEESVAHADGIEPAIALASKVGLLTPWTSFFWRGAGSQPWESRLLDLSSADDAAYAARVQPAPPPSSLLVEPPATFEGEASIEEAAEIAARHAIESAFASMVACRDARASIRPSTSDAFHIAIRIDGAGHPSRIDITAQDARMNDVILDRCLEAVARAIPFYAAGVAVGFSEDIALPPAQTAQRTACSVASTLPLAVRRGIWRARKAKKNLDYEMALHACEVPKWEERRALLGILVNGIDASAGTQLSRHLTGIGETDAAAFVQRELIRLASIGTISSEELRKLLVADEPKIDRALDKAYRAAHGDEARRAVLLRYLRLAPHSPLGRRLELAMVESTKDRNALLGVIDRIQDDPLADAGLLAECASTLRRAGMDREGRRAFGDLVERAPNDPWTLGYVGDRLRAEGLYEDALSAYQRLDAAMPDDPAVSLRLALAQAGAGRLDVAARLLDRVAQTGGRGDDGRLGELAAVVSASLLAKARQGSPSAETDALLARRLAETPLPDVASVILVRAPLGDDRLEVLVARQAKDKDELPADLDASVMGLSAVRIERGGGTARLRLRRTEGMAGSRPLHAVVTALVLASDRRSSHVVTREVDVPEGVMGAELRWNGSAFE